MWLTKIMYFSLALDAMTRMVPRILLTCLYVLFFSMIVIYLNEGWVALKHAVAKPGGGLKYVFNYLKWFWRNKEEVELVPFLKLIFSVCFPYIGYKLLLVVLRFLADKSKTLFVYMCKLLLKQLKRIPIIAKIVDFMSVDGDNDPTKKKSLGVRAKEFFIRKSNKNKTAE